MRESPVALYPSVARSANVQSLPEAVNCMLQAAVPAPLPVTAGVNEQVLLIKAHVLILPGSVESAFGRSGSPAVPLF